MSRWAWDGEPVRECFGEPSNSEVWMGLFTHEPSLEEDSEKSSFGLSEGDLGAWLSDEV